MLEWGRCSRFSSSGGSCRIWRTRFSGWGVRYFHWRGSCILNCIWLHNSGADPHVQNLSVSGYIAGCPALGSSRSTSYCDGTGFRGACAFHITRDFCNQGSQFGYTHGWRRRPASVYRGKRPHTLQEHCLQCNRTSVGCYSFIYCSPCDFHTPHHSWTYVC